jgi:hypothetical protein
MSRKDFRLIAETIRTLPSFNVKSLDDADCVRFSALVYRFADALATTNPRFDRQRFIAACNGKDKEPEEPVGILVHGDAVTCFGCETLGDHKVPLYRVNVSPYKQTCCKCHKVLVDSPCCELFTGRL